MHIIAAKAVCFKEAMEPAFVDYQKQIVANARRLAEGLTAAGFRLVSGGTDNHLMLVDVFSKGLTGKVAEAALGKAGITVNKNAIPFDQQSADGRERHPHRHTGRHQPRHARAGDGSRSPTTSPACWRRRTTTASRRRCGRKWRRCAGSFRCTPSRGPDRRRRRGVRVRRSARAHARGLRAARRTGRDGGSGRDGAGNSAACCWPRPAPAPARRSPISSRPSSAGSASSSRPAPRTSRSRSSSRICRSSSRRSACPSPPRA